MSDWASRTSAAMFVAFDLLELDGRVLVDEPHTVRREVLAGLELNGPRWGDHHLRRRRGGGVGGNLRTRPRGRRVQGPALDLGAAPVAAAAEGQARYGTFRVMGWAASTDTEPAGLVVGALGAVGELRVAGVAAFNVDRDVRATVMAVIDGLRTDRVPMVAPRWRRPVQWINDGLVAEVRYLERTPTGLLRHASARRVELAD